MRFIHGALDSGFWLWAEAPLEDAVAHSSKERWPYALTADALSELLQEAFGIRRGEAGEIKGWLPFSNGTAIASTPLVAEQKAARPHETKLVYCPVDAVEIPFGVVLDLLPELENAVLQPGIFCAPDLIYWAEAARFALHLLITQKYIPSLQEAIPLWRPVLLGEDRRRFDQLCRAMPGSARAFSGGQDAYSPSCRDLLWQFIERAINSVIEESHVSAPPQKSKTIHDHWLSALAAGSMQPALGKFPNETLAEFQGNLLHWTTPLLRRTSFDYRLAFRLEEPTPKKDFWYVRYFLQNESDPSLLIPLSKVWKYTRTAREIFGARYELAMQNALVSLAQAGKVDPFVEVSLLQPQPSGYEIETEEAWRFLNARAWILQDSGFGILLPSWWGRQRANLRLGLKARVKGTTKQSFASSEGNPLIDFDWKIAIGSEEIRYEELMALARLKTPLVKFRGKWVELRPEEIQAAINFWKAQQPQQASLSDLLRLMTGVEENVAGLPVASVEASGWLTDFSSRLQRARIL
jgi:SNF2 Helicase protein